MIARKPSILIYTNKPDRDLLREICAGIEEEGVFYEVLESEEGGLDDLAFEAASESILGSGIGMIGARAAMQMRGTVRGHNVFEVNHPDFAKCRALGANSARAIKRIAFKELYSVEVRT